MQRHKSPSLVSLAWLGLACAGLKPCSCGGYGLKTPPHHHHPPPHPTTHTVLAVGAPPGGYIIKPCPGAPAGTSCRAGVDSLAHGTDFLDPTGCCACRKTKSGGYTKVYNCKNVYVDELPDLLKPGTQVDYTGLRVVPDESHTCTPEDSDEILLQASRQQQTARLRCLPAPLKGCYTAGRGQAVWGPHSPQLPN